MEFDEKNRQDWVDAIRGMFSKGVPESSSWTKIPDMVEVLEALGKRNLNHMFFPSGGGLDLTGAQISFEEDCIELNTGGLFQIIKPKELTFEKITDDNEWSYFRIETLPLKPSGVYDDIDLKYEEVTELEPGRYVERYAWDNKEYNGQPIPKTARLLARILEGSFVIFKKSSIYNNVPSTYDGRHSKMTSEEFRNYILKAAKVNGV